MRGLLGYEEDFLARLGCYGVSIEDQKDSISSLVLN
jgi:hypothetical protein